MCRTESATPSFLGANILPPMRRKLKAPKTSKTKEIRKRRARCARKSTIRSSKHFILSKTRRASNLEGIEETIGKSAGDTCQKIVGTRRKLEGSSSKKFRYFNGIRRWYSYIILCNIDLIEALALTMCPTRVGTTTRKLEKHRLARQRRKTIVLMVGGVEHAYAVCGTHLRVNIHQ